MIGLFVLGHSFHTTSILEKMGLVGDGVLEMAPLKKKVGLSTVSHDLDDYIDEERMVDQGDRSWMNY